MISIQDLVSCMWHSKDLIILLGGLLQRHFVTWEQIRRTKNALTRDKCKLFLKLCTEMSSDGFFTVKVSLQRVVYIVIIVIEDIKTSSGFFFFSV